MFVLEGLAESFGCKLWALQRAVERYDIICGIIAEGMAGEAVST